MSAGGKRIVVLGAGVIGLCAAYYCARRGHRVTVIDREPEQRDGCSFGNAGMIVPSHFVPLAAPGMVSLALKWMFNPQSPFYIKPRLDADLFSWGWKFMRSANTCHVERSAPLLRDLSFASRACFEELNALPGADFGLVTRGLVMLCKTQQALDYEAAFAEQAQRLGVPAEVLDAHALARLEPNLTMDVAGGVYFPKDCHLPPHRFMGAMRQHCAALGVTFRWNTDVQDLRAHKQQLVSLDVGTEQIELDELVLCAGSWSPQIVQPLGLKIPMQAGKGYSVTLSKPPELPAICAILAEARVAVTPMDGALRFGGTMEIAGLRSGINAPRVQGIVNAAARYFPRFRPEHFSDAKPWFGFRPCSPDGLPYLGRSERFQNLIVATGHAMMGLSLGPISGSIVGEIVSGQKPSFDLHLLRPERFG